MELILNWIGEHPVLTVIFIIFLQGVFSTCRKRPTQYASDKNKGRSHALKLDD